MTKEIIKEFLEFRKKFTRREWQELNHIIDSRFMQKAAKLELDDFDIQTILENASVILRSE